MRQRDDRGEQIDQERSEQEPVGSLQTVQALPLFERCTRREQSEPLVTTELDPLGEPAAHQYGEEQ